jgi:hypothetical protein
VGIQCPVLCYLQESLILTDTEVGRKLRVVNMSQDNGKGNAHDSLEGFKVRRTSILHILGHGSVLICKLAVRPRTARLRENRQKHISICHHQDGKSNLPPLY